MYSIFNWSLFTATNPSIAAQVTHTHEYLDESFCRHQIWESYTSISVYIRLGMKTWTKETDSNLASKAKGRIHAIFALRPALDSATHLILRLWCSRKMKFPLSRRDDHFLILFFFICRHRLARIWMTYLFDPVYCMFCCLSLPARSASCITLHRI